MRALVLIALLVVGTVRAEEPDHEKMLSDAIERRKAVLIARLEAELEVARRSRKNDARGIAAKKRAVEKSKPFIPLLFPADIKVGDIGRLSGGASLQGGTEKNVFRVWHIIDKSNIIIFKEKGDYVDELVRPRYHPDFYVWVSGVDASTMVDDQYTAFPQVFHVESTIKFGGMTMLKLVVFPLQELPKK